MFVRIDIRFEISSFTHLLEVVMLFGPKNSKVNTVAAVYTFYLNLKLFQKKYFLKLQVFQSLGIGFPSRSSNL
jgi:hypothetical protein